MSWPVLWTKSDIQNWLPSLQCHRGFWVQGLQQNSFQSVQAACFRGYKIAEFDVRLTADGLAVLFHDEKYQDLVLEKTLYLDFKKRIQPEFSELSRLEDVLQWMNSEIQKDPQFDFKLNIEIKSKKIFDARLEKEVFRLIQKFNLFERILISSFNPFVLYRLRRYHSKLRRALLVTHDHESNWLLNAMFLNCLARPHVLHLRWNDLDEKVLKQVNGKVPIVLWTVNDLKLAQEKRKNIFGVISDRITPEEFQSF